MRSRDSAYQPETVELRSVPGFVVFDLPGAPLSAGGTRLAPDVSRAEVALLARAMTYKFAALGEPIGGAKAGVVGDAGDLAARTERMARYCAEIRPLVDAGRFLTGPDMGTSESDFAPLRERRAAPAAISAVIASAAGGVPFEDVLTGYGVVVAAQTALRADPDGKAAAAGHARKAGKDRKRGKDGGMAGRSVAIEGFGKVGGGVAREVANRGGLVVAVSTVAGCIVDPAGLDVERLLALRRDHGDGCVTRYGLAVSPPGRLFTVADAEVLVPGARPGVIDGRTAESLRPAVRVVAPAANVPYTAEGARVLRQRGIVALPDFVCNAGAVIGYRSAPGATPVQVLGDVEDKIAEIIDEALGHPGGPFEGACERAAGFLRGWWGEPPGPPLADDGPLI
jgi:glutamate dehydrogenase (NAD(P)+)